MQVNRIAVIGAGPIGRGIAYLSAMGGFETTLEDVRAQMLDQAMDWVGRKVDGCVQRGEIQADGARQTLARLRTAGGVEDAADADLVIEAGAEEMELKIELFGMLDKFARAGTILATTSRSLPVAEMAAVTQRPERCIGMRFFDSEPGENRVELVRGPQTSEETLEACGEVGRRMGKRW